MADDLGTLNALGDTMEVQYDLGRKCSKLAFTAGVADDSPSNTSAKYEVYADNSLVYSDSIQFGEAHQSHLSIEGALRIRIVVVSTSQMNLRAVFGDAKLTCQGVLTPQ